MILKYNNTNIIMEVSNYLEGCMNCYEKINFLTLRSKVIKYNHHYMAPKKKRLILFIGKYYGYC